MVYEEDESALEHQDDESNSDEHDINETIADHEQDDDDSKTLDPRHSLQDFATVKHSYN